MKRNNRIRRKQKGLKDHEVEQMFRRHPLGRYAGALRLLRDDLQRSLYMEASDGLGRYAAQTYSGIHEAVLLKYPDPFIEALDLEANPDGDDREVVSLVNLLCGQLLTFIEAEIEDDLEADDEEEDVAPDDEDDDLDELT